MADENDNDQVDGLEISNEDAERLLADDTDERRPRATREDDDTDESDDADGGLREQGRRALEAMKEQRKAARAERDKVKNELAEVQRELSKLKDGNKSELQRLIEERDALRTELGTVTSERKRSTIADQLAPVHATRAQVALVAKYLSGSTDEELESSAEELFSQFAPAPPKESTPKTSQRPKERLRPGNTDPEEDDEETDPRKLADSIRRNR